MSSRRLPFSSPVAITSIRNWPFWILVNTIAVPLYASRELCLTSFLYGCYWIDAVVSWISWRRPARVPDEVPAIA